jgi:CBS domain-containing protein
MGIDLKAKDIMKKNVITISPDATVSDLAMLLKDKKVTGVPVVDNKNKLVGVISGTDVIKRCDYISKELAKYEDEPEYDPYDGCVHIHRYFTEEFFNMKVKDLMSTPVYSMSPEASLVDVCKKITEKRMHRVILVEKDEVKGIIGTLDIVALFSEGRAEIVK